MSGAGYLLVLDEFFEVLGNGFRHGLLVLAAASLLIHRVGPHHLGRGGLDELNRDASLIFNSGAGCRTSNGLFSRLWIRS